MSTEIEIDVIEVEIQVPEWAGWIATDYDGSTTWFQSRPAPDMDCCGWFANSGRSAIAYHAPTPDDFTEELYEVVREDGMKEPRSHAVAELPRETVEALCDDFKERMLAKWEAGQR